MWSKEELREKLYLRSRRSARFRRGARRRSFSSEYGEGPEITILKEAAMEFFLILILLVVFSIVGTVVWCALVIFGVFKAAQYANRQFESQIRSAEIGRASCRESVEVREEAGSSR